MERCIKTLKGFSGSEVGLYENNGQRFVRKVGNVERNHERLGALSRLGYNVPSILRRDGDVLDLEYIHGLDMRSYLETGSEGSVIAFVRDTLTRFSAGSVDKDYSSVYAAKLAEIDLTDLPFTADEMMARLPKVLPSSVYHGDMTLENILHGEDEKFYLIDAVTIDYDSWVFDLVKMRQDLDCKWFLRQSKVMLDAKLHNIRCALLREFPQADDDNLLIMMLLRVFRHAPKDSYEYQFLKKEIVRLWK